MNEQLVERGDLDELTRHVENLVSQRDWDGLVDLRDRCRRALARGKQLWPIASHIEYRVALEAPGQWAATMLEPGAGRFSFGPLPEVAGSTHQWAELAPFVQAGPVAALAAHERVVRGEDLSGDATALALPPVFELPLALLPWEPAYPLADYRPDKADFPPPELPPLRPAGAGGGAGVGHATVIDDPEPIRALTELAATWTAESNGRAEAIAVEGDAAGAVAALGVPSARIRVAEIDPATALAVMAWAGASGGGHGRRRGAAAGRFAAWWTVAALSELLDAWPVSPDELGGAAAELSWFVWDAGEPDTGWTLRLAIEDPVDGLAWAVNATDAT